MKNILIILCTLTTFFSSAYSQQTSAKPALGMSIEFGDEFTAAEADDKQEIRSIIDTALMLVQAFSPKESNLFNWTEDRKILTGKSIAIYYTNSTDPIVASLINEAGMHMNSSVDMLTITLAKSPSDIGIFICVFQDRIFFNNKDIERTDGFTRLVVGLAHEIYGHVPTYLRLDYTKAKTTPNDRTAEIFAFGESITFIEQVLASLKDPKGELYDIDNKQKLIDDFTNALNREKAALQSWVNLKP